MLLRSGDRSQDINYGALILEISSWKGRIWTEMKRLISSPRQHKCVGQSSESPTKLRSGVTGPSLRNAYLGLSRQNPSFWPRLRSGPGSRSAVQLTVTMGVL